MAKIASKSPSTPEKCARCGALAGGDHCWCFDLPHRPIGQELTNCLCPACLEQEAKDRTNAANSVPGIGGAF
jgi:hypothetical protein